VSNFIVKLTLTLLSDQFQSNAVQALRPALETIDDVERLKQLLRAVPKAANLEAFMEILNQ